MVGDYFSPVALHFFLYISENIPTFVPEQINDMDKKHRFLPEIGVTLENVRATAKGSNRKGCPCGYGAIALSISLNGLNISKASSTVNKIKSNFVEIFYG
jgi:hypothetical protein